MRGRRRCSLWRGGGGGGGREGAPEDAVFRLVLAALDEMQVGRVWMPVTYFALWMSRLMGWMPELGHCVVCGLDLRGGTGWYSATSDGVTCGDDRRAGSVALWGGAGGGSAPVCDGDAGAASRAAVGERESVGKRVRVDGSVD